MTKRLIVSILSILTEGLAKYLRRPTCGLHGLHFLTASGLKGSKTAGMKTVGRCTARMLFHRMLSASV